MNKEKKEKVEPLDKFEPLLFNLTRHTRNVVQLCLRGSTDVV